MLRRHSKGDKERVRSTGRKPKILIVDENDKDLSEYTRLLRLLGYEISPFDSYSQAVASLVRERFSLVFVEQGSPAFEGLSVITRAVEVGSHGPILVLARIVDVECCLEALDSGAAEYVQKPLTMSELRQLVNDYLEVPVGTLAAA